MCFTHVYGPTENTTFSTSEIIGSGTTSLPIGRPICGTRAYVVDHVMNLVPIGTPGELYLGGEGLARGYFGRPELTAEKFVPDPFSSEPGARLYATGDTVRWNSAGTLDFLGRIDNQVKIRGFRVEPEEIQLFLESLTTIRTARVVPYKAQDGTNAITAYVVPDEPALLHGNVACRVFEDEVHEMVRAALPHYMVPQRVIALAELPLNQNGKVDYNRLQTPVEYDARRAQSRVDCSAFEEFVSKLWREVLHVDHVQRHDDFFALGGHSLKAMQMKMVLKTRLDVDVPIRLIFDERRLDRFSAALERLVQEQVAE
jgi:acyl-CoA synthetase (AMP-forming)/AMP-acid ligase II